MALVNHISVNLRSYKIYYVSPQKKENRPLFKVVFRIGAPRVWVISI